MLPTTGGTYGVGDATDTTGGTTSVAVASIGSCTLRFTPTSGSQVTAPYTFTSIN